jgi:hypothetical protein
MADERILQSFPQFGVHFAQTILNACHHGTFEAARIDAMKRRRVSGKIDRAAVIGDPLSNGDSD